MSGNHKPNGGGQPPIYDTITVQAEGGERIWTHRGAIDVLVLTSDGLTVHLHCGYQFRIPVRSAKPNEPGGARATGDARTFIRWFERSSIPKGE